MNRKTKLLFLLAALILFASFASDSRAEYAAEAFVTYLHA
jgi:hypothetical protein